MVLHFDRHLFIADTLVNVPVSNRRASLADTGALADTVHSLAGRFHAPAPASGYELVRLHVVDSEYGAVAP